MRIPEAKLYLLFIFVLLATLAPAQSVSLIWDRGGDSSAESLRLHDGGFRVFWPA